MIYSGHTGALDDIAATVRATTAALAYHRERFDVVAVSGMSGVLVGSPVAIQLDRQLVVVRKPHDDSHDCSSMINARALKTGTRYLFLDDFVSLGTTFSRVYRRMREFREDAVYAGTYLYSPQVLSWDIDHNDEWPRRFRGYARNA